MDESSGISEDAPYRDPKVPKRLVPLAHQSIRLHLLPGERVLGMFSSMRMRRSITLLVVTDVRLLTLGDEHVGLPVVDEVLRADVTEVSIEREKVFSVGSVTARTRHGDVNLGTLNYGKQTFLKLDEILALPTSGAMPVIPTSGPSSRAGGMAGGPTGGGSCRDADVRPSAGRAPHRARRPAPARRSHRRGVHGGQGAVAGGP